MSDDVRELISEIDGLSDTESSGYLYSLLDRVRAALEASVQAPAVDKEALARLLHKQEGEPHEDWKDFRPNVEEIIASGILQDAAEVEARGLEKAADELYGAWRRGLVGSETNWLRARAQQVREGKA